MKKRYLACLIALAACTAHAADSHIDPSIWYPSADAEAADRTALTADWKAVPVLQDPDPQALLDYMHRVEALLARSQRHDAWLHLHTALDVDDHASRAARSALAEAKQAGYDRMRKTLRNVGDAGFAKATSAVPALGEYHWLLEQATRHQPHELPEAEQAIMDDIGDQDSEAFWAIYQKTRRAMDGGKVPTAHGDLDAIKDAGKLAKDPDRAVREQAWEQEQKAQAAQGETYAATLMGIVRLNDKVAKLRHFADAPNDVYFSRFLTRADVDATAKAVEDKAQVLQAYQALRAKHIAKVLGIADVHSWDLSAPLDDFTPPAFDEAAMRDVIPKALAPIGSDYSAHFRALLDPANHRTDLATTLGTRESDAFAIAAPGAPATLFISQWVPKMGAASVVAHEGGHALNQQLMDEHGVSPFYRGGPNWMMEGIAILNEMLFYEYLYRHTNDPAAKAYYLQSQLDEMTFEIFTSAEEAQLEAGIYDGVVAGKFKNAADLDAFTLDTAKRFEIWPAKDPELAHAWMGKRLMYQDPLYLANYLYAGLLATKMFAMATKDPTDFQKRYAALMAEGFDAPPKELLKHFFGKDLSPAELVDADMTVIQAKVAALGKLYK
ncbi:M3 family metallopeptidase [Luteibacter yeojuensis]|uniref:Peptidase M3A/M3B catalytic domain-containing protein n=1 Tax=Luteibacter yeojuensis TaxID=345309 RepID=A0A0F3KNH0_9GAMM|nr:M3 family metallopeptidase [Luteibacter yeojuensis]KJV32532.1 hypothetical protein VI08_12430 [Luteibacter yeojuensis]